MTIKIEEELVDFYLREFTFNWFEDHEDAPDDLNDYNELIQGVRRHLHDVGETEDFKQALAYLIKAPDNEVKRFDGGSGFSIAELRDLMTHIYQQIWGEPPTEADRVVFIAG